MTQIDTPLDLFSRYLDQAVNDWLPTLGLGLVITVIGYRLVRRFRKMVGPQPYKPIGLSVRWLILAPIAVAMAGLTWLRGPWGLLAIPAGIAVGLYADRSTDWDRTEEGVVYTPNPSVNLAVFALICGRIGHRMAMLLWGGPDQLVDSWRASRSPLTTSILLFVLVYFLVQSGFVIVRGWGKRREATKPAP